MKGRWTNIASRLGLAMAALALLAVVGAGTVLGDETTASEPAAVPKCLGKTATIVGTEGDDELVGHDEADVIVGLGGNDHIVGRKGADVACGGDGDDRIAGGKGNDKLFGGPGRDGLKGGPGHDVLLGGPDADKLVQ
jgi:Ca2+-binding RTX toxin-like protein